MNRYVGMGIILVLLGTGCGRPPGRETDLDDRALTRTYGLDAITVTLSTSTTNLTTIGQVRLVLDVVTPRPLGVTFPDLPRRAEAFTLIGYLTEPPRTLPTGNIHQRQSWDLAPNLPGQAMVPALDVKVGEVTLTTDPIAMDVVSVLPADRAPLEICDIAGPVERLHEASPHRAVLFVAGVSVVLVIGIFAFRRRIRAARKKPSPHQAALRALSALPFPPSEPITFIHELDHILRSFLHAQYRVPALASTHRELGDLLDDPELLAMLDQFDGIKFARKIVPGFPREAHSFVRGYIETSAEAVTPCD